MTVKTGIHRPSFASQANPWEMVLAQLEAVASQMKLDPYVKKKLASCKRALVVSIPIRMDDGSVEVFEGYRVQHNLDRGPAKGGIIYHPDVTLDEAKAQAFWMTLKCAVMGLPYGGATGAVRLDPKKLSLGELERVTRRFTSEISIIIGPEKDILAPDVYTNSQTMAWIMDTYSMGVGYSAPGVVTGKPVEIGGSLGRNESTGRGVAYVIRSAFKELGWKIPGATAAVQGFGNAGTFCAKLLVELGFKIIAVSDSRGGIRCDKGLAIPKLLAIKDRGGSVTEHSGPGVTRIGNKEILETECDVLVPAALWNQITGENAGRLKCRMIAEAANGPTTPEADPILYRREIFVLPDILANAGGVTVSYLEWVQDLQAYFWQEGDVNRHLDDMMEKSFRAVYGISKSRKVDMRMAAHMVAIESVAKAIKLRGLYP